MVTYLINVSGNLFNLVISFINLSVKQNDKIIFMHLSLSLVIFSKHHYLEILTNGN